MPIKNIYYAKIRINGEIRNLGTFRSKIDAAECYDRAAIFYHGEFATVNFPRK